MNVLASLITKLQLHLPLENVPRMREDVRFLDNGLMAFGCYLIAYDEYLEKNYEKSLGASEIALCLCEENYVIPIIFSHMYNVHFIRFITTPY